MASLAELRARFPQYNEVTDGDFLAALNRKFYPNVHPRTFFDSIEGATNAHATIRKPELREWFRAEVQKPIGQEPEATRAVRLGGQLTPGVTEGGALGTAMRSGLQGLTFGAGDEIVAAGVSALRPDLDYSQALEQERARLAMGRQNHPVLAPASEIGGGVLTGVAATSGIAPATTLAGRFGQAIGIGGASGALYGGLTGEGGIANRAQDAMLGGLIGAGVGAASVPAEIALRRAGDAAYGMYQNLSGSVKPERVETALAQAIAGSRQAPAQITDDLMRATQEGQPVYTLADALGTPGQRELSGAARLGGRAKMIATETLDRRQAGQGERIGAALADALGAKPKPPGADLIPWRAMSPEEEAEAIARAAAARLGTPLRETAEQTRARMVGARGKVADAAYEAARQGADPVDVRAALAAIDDRIGPMQGSGIRGDGIDSRLSSYRSRLAAQPGGEAFPGASSVELSDFDRVLGVKQAIQDDIGAAVRAGRNNEARELNKVVAALDEALEAASPDYRAANDGFRRASREIDQIDAGANATRPGRRAADTVAEYRPLTDAEKQAYRAGYGDRLLARLENAAEGVNKARPFTSQKSTEELAAMAADPARLARVLDRENVMFETRRIALGGSQTADNLADMQSVGGLVQRAANAVRHPLQTVADAADWAGRMTQGQNDATRAALVDALLSTGDQAAANIARAVARGEQLSADQALALRTILYLQGGGVAQTAR